MVGPLKVYLINPRSSRAAVSNLLFHLNLRMRLEYISSSSVTDAGTTVTMRYLSDLLIMSQPSQALSGLTVPLAAFKQGVQSFKLCKHVQSDL